MKIAIFGRKNFTANYENYVKQAALTPIVTLNQSYLAECDALILPGGGDITPAFFGERNTGSLDIDTELDILQFQALEYAISLQMPVLGICKGMQIINVAFGGTITQNLPHASYHKYIGHDQYHDTVIAPNSCLHGIFENQARVNSAHHQGVNLIGRELTPIQWSDYDQCVEALAHNTLPILGLQWHPERLLPAYTKISGSSLLSLLISWIYVGRS